MKRPEQPRVPSSNDEWAGGVFELPSLSVGGKPTDTSCAIWVDAATGAVLGATIEAAGHRGLLRALLLECMARPKVGPPRAPARLRVPTREAALVVSGVRPGLSVAVGAVPEVDDAFRSLSAHLGLTRHDDPTQAGTISGEVLDALQRAAIELWRAAPWHTLDDEAVYEVELAATGSSSDAFRSGILQVLGAAGEVFGFALYPTFASWRAQEEFSAGQPFSGRPGDRMLLLMIQSPEELSPVERRNASFPVELGGRYAVAVAFAQPDRMDAHTEAEVALVTRLASALARWRGDPSETLEGEGIRLRPRNN